MRITLRINMAQGNIDGNRNKKTRGTQNDEQQTSDSWRCR
jgi:hypothetical protein